MTELFLKNGIRMSKQLDAREVVFRDEYLKTLKPYDAAIAAGYAETTAKTKAFTWVSDSKCPDNKRHLLEAINQAKAERSERTQIDADWLLKRLADEAEADLSDIYNEVTGQLRPIKEWPKIWRQGLVAGVKTRQERFGEDEVAEIVEVKLADRNAKLKMIGDHIGVQAFKKQVDHNHTHKWEDLTDEQLDAEIARRQSGKN